MINTLGDAQVLCEKIGSRHLGIAADTYHMNIEEADPPKALIDAGSWIRHVQLSDSNRLEPGAGHIDWSGDSGCAVGHRLRQGAGLRVPAVRRGGRGAACRGAPDQASRMVLAAKPEIAAPSEHDRLLREAVRVLLQNWHGHATVPSRSLYPHQWSWDSAFIALGLEHISAARAATELLSLFGAQWADGRIPHIAFNPAVPDDAYFPGPSVWQSSAIEGHPPIDTSGIIQPPLHAVAAASILSRLGDRGLRFAERAYPCLVDQNAYIRRRRTVDGGLAALVHPWETGLDNSPAWDHPLAAVPADLTLFETYTRRDVAHAGVGERPTDEDYARYIRLMLKYRDHGYDDDWVRAEAEFLVVDPAFNALWAWSELALAEHRPSARPR